MEHERRLTSSDMLLMNPWMLVVKLALCSFKVLRTSFSLGKLICFWISSLIWLPQLVIWVWASLKYWGNWKGWVPVCCVSTSLDGTTLPSTAIRTTARTNGSKNFILLILLSTTRATESLVNSKTTAAQDGLRALFYRRFLSKGAKCLLSHFDDNDLRSSHPCRSIRVLGRKLSDFESVAPACG